MASNINKDIKGVPRLPPGSAIKPGGVVRFLTISSDSTGTGVRAGRPNRVGYQ